MSGEGQEGFFGAAASSRKAGRAKSLPKRQQPTKAPSPTVQAPSFTPLPPRSKHQEQKRVRDRLLPRMSDRECPVCQARMIEAFDSGLWAVVCVTAGCPRCPGSGEGYVAEMDGMRKEREASR